MFLEPFSKSVYTAVVLKRQTVIFVKKKIYIFSSALESNTDLELCDLARLSKL